MPSSVKRKQRLKKPKTKKSDPPQTKIDLQAQEEDEIKVFFFFLITYNRVLL